MKKLIGVHEDDSNDQEALKKQICHFLIKDKEDQ